MTEDEKKYMDYMDKYKRERIKDRKGAIKYLMAANEIKKGGNVSQDVVIGAAYL